MKKIALIGLGYVGLPLARLFATKYPVVGFDVNKKRIVELMNGFDSTLEVEDGLLQNVLKANLTSLGSAGLYCSSLLDDIRDCNVYIITVPTPVDDKNRPDLRSLIKASQMVGRVISTGDIVIYESTVYPGVTEEVCIPVVEESSGLKYNEEFFAGYSPERINPGDKEHTVEHIKKVTSGSNPKIGQVVDELYNSVLLKGTHLAPSIRVAEASKIIENCQRDVNIAFFNELAKVFNVIGIDTNDVIDAAASKWNFINLRPGLVGGHCISVDPYYLIEKSQIHGYSPNVLIQARAVNDGMGRYVAHSVIKEMNKKGILVKDSNILILGITFKENCPDIRNTKVVDVFQSLREYTDHITVYDPWANGIDVKHEYDVDVVDELPEGRFDVVILAVGHQEFLSLDLQSMCKENGMLYDVKGLLPKECVDARL